MSAVLSGDAAVGEPRPHHPALAAEEQVVPARKSLLFNTGATIFRQGGGRMGAKSLSLVDSEATIIPKSGIKY